ncbi:phage antirepressor KilAC domain-containing protein [Propionimicrobium sp. PCR01-08-3]|uniref:phage antirepressor KilAC domain-containing protein n=1 Tax=Propionimicrobium sp. PCR01-08-3 TaxID=3052086 RepID=UPI00255CA264|nr:phage antirepressor KilAC domain-containing protein [Propionimicrobium sp. PCR01-08-3]WIY84301.1 phage antirepressor KilAC domain-containing protein [Propionimicrobium sp. PCR01-08-3]
MTITFVGGDNRSPFDQIKKTRPDGSEYWSARELAPVMGYSAWRNLEVPINRAISSAINQGIDVATNFAGSRKITATKPQEDYELSRFAAYLVAMNGDPNKPEVAGAQAYFAVRTREAEVAKPALDLSSLDSISAILDAGKAALNRAQAAERRALALEGPAAQAQTMREADGLRTISDLANDLKVHAQSNYPGVKVLRDDIFDLAGRCGLIIRGNTVRNNQPTAQAIEAGWVKPKDHEYQTKHHGVRATYYARLTPRGYARLWDAAIANLRTYGQVLAPRKEIA